MFIGLTNAFQRDWLLGLLVLWAALLFGGFVFGAPHDHNHRRMPTWTRLCSSLILVIAGWSWYTFSRGTSASTLTLLIAVGMTFGWLGDLLMAGVFRLAEPVLGGIGAFGLGHVAYIAALLLAGNQAGPDGALGRWLVWLAWLLVGLLGWYLVVYRGARGHPTVLHWAALPYALLLASTAGCAAGLATQAWAFAPAAAGASLFLISDLILAAHRFNNVHFYLIDDAVWLTYGPGQMLIVFALGNALTLGLR
jgi:hypothetical protein